MRPAHDACGRAPVSLELGAWRTQLANPQGSLPKLRPRVLHGVHGQRFPRQGAGIHLLWYGSHDPRRGAYLDGARRLAVLRRSPAFVSAVLRTRDRLCGPHPSQRQSDGFRHGLRVGHPACAVRRLRLGNGLVPLQKAGERDPAFRHTDERPADVHRRPAEPRGCRRAWGIFHVLNGFRHSAERGGAALSGHLWGDHRLHLLFLAVAAHAHRGRHFL